MPVLENPRNRQAGEHVTSGVAAPARGQGQATLFRATLQLEPADLADPALTMSVALEGSIDNVVWAQFARIEGWQGGQIGRDGNPTIPRLSWMASDNRVLTRVRVRWVQSRAARIGASLDTEARTVS